MKRMLIVIVIVCINYFCFNYVIEKRLDCVEVIVASCDILPRTIIKKEHVSKRLIPKQLVSDDYVVDESSIFNKVVSIQGMIPKNTPFFKSVVETLETTMDYASLQLFENQVAISLEADKLHMNVASIAVHQKIDLVLSVNVRGSNPQLDTLFEHVRILSIKDRKGYEMTDKNSTRIPYLVTIAVDKEDVNVLMMASKVGVLEVVVPYDTYTSTEEATLNKESELVKSLLVE